MQSPLWIDTTFLQFFKTRLDMFTRLCFQEFSFFLTVKYLTIKMALI